MTDLTPRQCLLVLDELRLAVYVFSERRLAFQNQAGRALIERLRKDQGIELLVTLQDHIATLRTQPPRLRQTVTLLVAANGEPFYVHMNFLPSSRGREMAAVSVREIGLERDAVGLRYGLSKREGQILELVLRGYGNRDIGAALGISPGTTKKHLTHIFDKVGVDSRAQLISRLA